MYWMESTVVVVVAADAEINAHFWGYFLRLPLKNI
jgi:hypothetical protein